MSHLHVPCYKKGDTTYGENIFDKTIYVRCSTEPNEKVKTIYQALE